MFLIPPFSVPSCLRERNEEKGIWILDSTFGRGNSPDKWNQSIKDMNKSSANQFWLSQVCAKFVSRVGRSSCYHHQWFWLAQQVGREACFGLEKWQEGWWRIDEGEYHICYSMGYLPAESQFVRETTRVPRGVKEGSIKATTVNDWSPRSTKPCLVFNKHC